MRGLAILLLFPILAAADALRIENVQADPRSFSAAAGESVEFKFRLSMPADVELNIFDARDLLIRSVRVGSLRAGEHSTEWDGKDERGRVVPPEAYVFALVADAGDQRVVYDLTDATGADPFIPTAVEWSPNNGRINYVLDRPARINIRIGLNDSGPLLRTVSNWVARDAGAQSELWDGWDASQVVELGEHPRLEVQAQAFSLPDNTLLVDPPAPTVSVIEDLAWERIERTRTQVASKRMYAHAQQPLSSRGDYRVRLILPNASRTETGIPVVSGGIVPVRLEVDSADLARAMNRRFEPVFFVDGQFVFENEVGFVPMTWNWDASAVNDGEHVLTVNVRGYEGNFGIASIRVMKQGAPPAGTGDQ